MKKTKNITKITNTCGVGDVENWLYSDVVKDHFFHPRNILINDADYVADGVGVVGSPACGDMMAVWIKVYTDGGADPKRAKDPKVIRIKECMWRTFGCASAIASTSMMSVMATENGGMTLAQAKRMTPEAIIDRLGGLPNRKYHCSVLGHEALCEAVKDYEQKKKI